MAIDRVVDTNVAVVANRGNDAASDECVAKCGSELHRVMLEGRLFVDEAGKIIAEYRSHLSPNGQPGPGDAFFKWVLTHEWSATRVIQVATDVDPVQGLEKMDVSDQKFIEVALAAAPRPVILQALDSKWWGWRSDFKRILVKVDFLCATEIEAIYRAKME